LSLSRNNIRKITGLDEIGQTLKELWLSYNKIDKLDGLGSCVKLEIFFISNNLIKSWDEVSKLAQLPALKDVLLWGNPVYSTMTKEEAKPYVVKRLKDISIVDGKMIDDMIRKKAEELQ
jgi:dynein light chain 1